MRVVLLIVATACVLLGLWLVAAGFIPSDTASGASAAQLSAPSQNSAGPIMLGLSLLAGGVLFFVLILRRQ